MNFNLNDYPNTEFIQLLKSWLASPQSLGLRYQVAAALIFANFLEKRLAIKVLSFLANPKI